MAATELKLPKKRDLKLSEYAGMAVILLIGSSGFALVGVLCGWVLRNVNTAATGTVVLGVQCLLVMVFIVGRFIYGPIRRWLTTLATTIVITLAGGAIGLLFSKADPVVFGAIVGGIFGLICSVYVLATLVVCAIASNVSEERSHLGV